jgi:hypothetical protein
MRLSSLSSLIVIVPIAGVICIALWLTAAAAYENVRFEQAKLQLLSLIAAAQDDAKDSDFSKRAGEDLLAACARRGQPACIGDDKAATGRLLNAWNQPIRMTAVSPSVMRLETDVPAHICRRFALFFGKDASAMKLQSMEAREESSHWRVFFDGASGQIPDYATTSAACGAGEHAATLAFVLQLR